MKWLYRIVARLCGCRHRWVIYSRNIVADHCNHKIGMRYHLRCRRCGWVRSKYVGQWL